MPHIETEKVIIQGPAGQLEAVLGRPDNTPTARHIAVVCHPHSLYGGSLRNKVTHILADTFTGMGLPTLRFNFRGVGQSAGQFNQGKGEQADLAAAVAWLRQCYPSAPLWLAGFSFGAFVAFRAHQAVAAERLLLVAPPVNLFDFGPPEPVSIPWQVILGSRDEIVDPGSVRDWVHAQPNPPVFNELEGASHFFHGRLNELKATIRAEWC